MNYVESLDLLGSEVKQIPNITGAGAPTTETEGVVGCQYMDTLTGDIYKCTAVEDGVCTWILTTVLATTLENNDTDKAPSVKAVNEGLAEKVKGQKFASGKNRMYCARANNPNAYYEMDSKPWVDCIPVYTNVESNIAPSTSQYGQATIVVVTPKHPYQSANKKYVDDTTEALQHAIINALGTKYETITDTANDPWMSDLDNALRYIYIDHATVTFLDGDGNELTDAIDITEMSIWPTFESGKNSRTVSFTSGSYFELEYDENMLYFEYGTVAAENGINYDSFRIDKKVVYQVKVGA